MRILDSPRPTQIIEHSGIPYEEYIAWQADRIEKRKRNEVPDAVSIMIFSDSVYTTPEGGVPTRVDLEDVILKAKRGGSDTWHGPGQIIVAPVVRLADGFLVKEVSDFLEAPIRRVLAEYGVTPDEHGADDFPGIQVEGRKIAQMGLNLDERVTSYGVAFNVTCDLRKFDAIDLCGIENCAVTKLDQEAMRSVDLTEVFDLVSLRVKEAFQYEDWMA